MGTRLVEGYIFLAEILYVFGEECQHILFAVIGLLSQCLVAVSYTHLNDGRKFVTTLQVNVEQRGVEFVPGTGKSPRTAMTQETKGDTLTLKATSITEGKTKPKPLHTEATLLSAMETAGKEIEDDALRQAMRCV